MTRRAAILRHLVKPCTCVLACALGISPASAQEPTETRIHELIEQLSDEDEDVALRASEALADIGAPAVPGLSQTLKRTTCSVADRVVATLASIGPEATLALTDTLSHGKACVRSLGAMALGAMGPAGKPGVSALKQALSDANPGVRWSAGWALANITGAGAIPALMRALGDDDLTVGSNAGFTLAQIGAEAVPALIGALSNQDEDIRSGAARALGQMGRDSQGSVLALTEALEDESYAVRFAAARALARIGSGADAGLPVVIEALNSDDSRLRWFAVDVLGQIGEAAVPALVQAVMDRDEMVYSSAARVLRDMGAKAEGGIPALVNILQDRSQPRELRYRTAQLLVDIGPAANGVVSALLVALKDGLYLGESLRTIGAEAVPGLVEALTDTDPVVQCKAAELLGNIGPEAKPAVSALTKALASKSCDVCAHAAEALGNIGREAKLAIRPLIQALESECEESDQFAPDALALKQVRIHQALGKIAQELALAGDTTSVPELENALDALIAAECEDAVVTSVRVALAALRDRAAIEGNVGYDRLLQTPRDHPWVSGIALLELALLVTWLLVLWWSPVALLGINSVLLPYEFGLHENLGGIKFPLRYILLVGFFHYRGRVLDAWVRKHLDTARKNFKKKATVAARQTHVPVPVVLDDQGLPSIGAEQLRETCKEKRWCLLIHGEGGAGKTSLACQIAHWAMAEKRASGLCKHRMLPVLIEQELDFDDETPNATFHEAMRGQLQDLVGQTETISAELLAQLLRKQRILVIVDHLSEMSEETRRAIRPGHPSFLPYALIVTSRRNEELDQVSRTAIKPRRIDGNRLSSFMESYLTQVGKRELFDDPEYFTACGKLSQMVGERDITVLLAKLYADQMVYVKEGADDDTLPDNVPDLMLQYLKILNRERTEDDPDHATVQNVAKIVAWECLRRTYRAASGMRPDILRALDGIEQAEQHLDYLETGLRVVRKAGVSDEKILFELDPLAEYLAGLRVVELHRDNEEMWHEFLADADKQPEAPESIKGFLLAVRDCCLTKHGESNVPQFVVQELGNRAGLDPEAVREAQLRQRIQRLVANVGVPETEDRLAAIKTLAQIGPQAKTAVPALADALKDKDWTVRRNAAKALESIGPAAKGAVPVLVEALKDEVREIRYCAAVALTKLGPGARPAVPALSELLFDESPRIRVGAARALGAIGAEAKAAVPALTDALKDERTRDVAEKALQKIRGESREHT